MQAMKLFIDTHDKDNGSFPANLTPKEFEAFFTQYEQACLTENVLVLDVHVGYGDGRAFCLTMAPDADAVRRAHERVNLPFDSITEVKTAIPNDAFFHPQAA